MSSLVFLGIIVWAINAIWLLKIRHRIKNLFVAISFTLGICLLILSKKYNTFWLCVVGIWFVGCGCSLGDAVNLGFLKGFPPTIMGSYCGGIGFSACVGSITFLILKISKVGFEIVFAWMLVFCPLYFLAFLILIRLKHQIHNSGFYLLPQNFPCEARTRESQQRLPVHLEKSNEFNFSKQSVFTEKKKKRSSRKSNQAKL